MVRICPRYGHHCQCDKDWCAAIEREALRGWASSDRKELARRRLTEGRRRLPVRVED